MSKISDILDPVELPEIVKVRQIFEHRDLLNVYETLFQKLEERKLDIKPGQRIAITCGSRGIDKYPLMVKTT